MSSFFTENRDQGGVMSTLIIFCFYFGHNFNNFVEKLALLLYVIGPETDWNQFSDKFWNPFKNQTVLVDPVKSKDIFKYSDK